MEKFCAIVPYRNDGGSSRRRNAEIILRWLSSGGVPALLVEHSDSIDESLQVSMEATRIHLPAHGHDFNKSLACNAGVVEAKVPVVALVDADTFISMPRFLECLHAVQDEFEVIRPFGKLIELDESETQELAGGGEFPQARVIKGDEARRGERIPLGGGIVIIRTATFLGIGGMDESFEGWGGEDDAFTSVLTRTNAHRAILETEVAFHLNHPRLTESRYMHPNYEKNVARMKWWNDASNEEIDRAMRLGHERLIAKIASN
jgi:predicted glycosyltransferase involved in capsule biosynthesis